MSRVHHDSSAPGIIRFCFNTFAKMIAYLLLSFIILIVLHLMMVWYFGEQWTEHYMTQLLLNQTNYVDRAIMDPMIGSQHSMTQWIQGFYQMLLIKSGFKNAILSLSSYAHKGSLLNHVTNFLLYYGKQIGMAIMYAFPIALLKVLILLFAIPLMGVFCLGGVVDGLVAREIRRYQNDRESSLLFHHAKRLSRISLWLGVTVFMLLPIDVSPTWILVPMSMGVSFGVYMTLKHYKKYL